MADKKKRYFLIANKNGKLLNIFEGENDEEAIANAEVWINKNKIGKKLRQEPLHVTVILEGTCMVNYLDDYIEIHSEKK